MTRTLLMFTLALAPLAAHASPITFNFNSVLDPNSGTGGSVSGSITIDTATGAYVSSSLSSNYGGTKYAVSSSESSAATTNGSLVIFTFGSIGGSDAFLSLVFPTSSLVGYKGGSVCDDTARCAEPNNSNYSSSYFAPGSQFGDGLTSGALTLPSTPTVPPAAAVTPEPSGVALLGTGMLGIAGLLRRRLARAAA